MNHPPSVSALRRSPTAASLHPPLPWALGWHQCLEQQRLIAVIHAPSYEAGLAMAAAAVAGGLGLLEVTLTSDRPFALVTQLRDRYPQCQVGVGSVISLEQWEAAVAAGAQFGFSPIIPPRVIDTALRQGIPFMPGALTPNEIWWAWQLGATAVKVFPIQNLGGPSYLQQLKTPLQGIPLIPTGGISGKDAEALLQAGALALGIGGTLFSRSLVQTGNWQAIAQRAADLAAQVKPWCRSR